MKWFRFYSGFRSDPKMKRMPVQHRYAFIVLLCLASESKDRGTISGLDDDDLAHELEMATEDWQTLKAKFRVKGLIDFVGDAISILDWNERQFVSDSSAARVSAHRERKRQSSGNATVTLQGGYCNAEVTDVTGPDPYTDTEIRSEILEVNSPSKGRGVCNSENPTLFAPAETNPSRHENQNRTEPECELEMVSLSGSPEVDGQVNQPGSGRKGSAKSRTTKKSTSEKAEAVYRQIKDRDRFEEFFKWYTKQVRKIPPDRDGRVVREGSKVEAAREWADLEQQGLIEEFAVGCGKFKFNQLGVPHACRFISKGFWRSGLPVTGGDDFLPKPVIAPQVAEPEKPQASPEEIAKAKEAARRVVAEAFGKLGRAESSHAEIS
jgi:hypothetical protein